MCPQPALQHHSLSNLPFLCPLCCWTASYWAGSASDCLASAQMWTAHWLRRDSPHHFSSSNCWKGFAVIECEWSVSTENDEPRHGCGLGRVAALEVQFSTCSSMNCGTCTRFEPSARRLQGMRGSAAANSFRTWQNLEWQLVQKQEHKIMARLPPAMCRSSDATWQLMLQQLRLFLSHGRLKISSTWFLIAPINMSRHPVTWTSFKLGHWRSNRSAESFTGCKYSCTNHL